AGVSLKFAPALMTTRHVLVLFSWLLVFADVGHAARADKAGKAAKGAAAPVKEFVPVRNVTDPGVVVTRQGITPAGAQSVFDGRVYGVAFGPKGDEVWVLDAKRLVGLNWRENRVTATIPLGAKPGLQGITVDATGRPFFT